MTAKKKNPAHRELCVVAAGRAAAHAGAHNAATIFVVIVILAAAGVAARSRSLIRMAEVFAQVFARARIHAIALLTPRRASAIIMIEHSLDRVQSV